VFIGLGVATCKIFVDSEVQYIIMVWFDRQKYAFCVCVYVAVQVMFILQIVHGRCDSDKLIMCDNNVADKSDQLQSFGLVHMITYTVYCFAYGTVVTREAKLKLETWDGENETAHSYSVRCVCVCAAIMLRSTCALSRQQIREQVTNSK
jgi:hypothetical protein